MGNELYQFSIPDSKDMILAKTGITDKDSHQHQGR